MHVHVTKLKHTIINVTEPTACFTHMISNGRQQWQVVKNKKHM